MSIIFHPNIRNLFIGKGILEAGYLADCAITVYSGAQPTAADIIDNWVNYTSANPSFLCHFVATRWIHPLSGSATFCSLTKFPVATLPTNPGIGTWAILWITNPTLVAMAGAIPSTQFLIVPVSSVAGNGVIRFDPNPTFTLGVAKTITDGVISASST